jgi:hypothetical protein
MSSLDSFIQLCGTALSVQPPCLPYKTFILSALKKAFLKKKALDRKYPKANIIKLNFKKFNSK